MKDKGKSAAYIAKITNLIKATAKEYVPQMLLEKIVKDADYYHVFSTDYLSSCEVLREEWENTEVKSYSDKDWAVENLDFLVNKHRFYTDYAVVNWQPLKELNIKKIKEKIKKNELESI